MANHKYHWAIKVGNPRQHRNAWKPGWGGYCVQACGRKYVSTAFPDSAADFVNRAKCNPDWHCSDCATQARLALAKESAPTPSDVVWPKPRPISERSGLKPYMLYEEYRIGERLRPCPGCFDCAVECWVCHEPHDPPDELCGGSGVIRAGKLRTLVRKPDCGFYID